MTWRKLLFWLPEENANSSSARSLFTETEACREWTPFLTALFDGEADEEGAARARRHLLVCERCARAWMDWNQTRSLLINHSAPPPPPSLLWRIRLACRLGNPEPARSAEPAAPQLAAQILARTTRQSAQPAKPTFGFAALFAGTRNLHWNAPMLGAVAMGAFLLFITRDTLLVSSSPPIARNSPAIVNRNQRLNKGLGERMASAATAVRDVMRAKARLTSPRSTRENEGDDEEGSAPRILKVNAPRREERRESNSSSSLERARRERESLSSSPVRFASFESAEPLPMLPPPRPVPVAPIKAPKPAREVLPTRPPKLASLPRTLPRSVASAPRITPPVMLASFETPPAASPEPVPSVPRPRRSSASSATLRASTPHALPVIVTEPPAPDSTDDSLDDLNSTIENYRATLSTDDFESDGELG